MKCASVTTAHEELLTGGWSKKNVERYRRAPSLHIEVIGTIVNCAFHSKDNDGALALSMRQECWNDRESPCIKTSKS